MPLQNQLDAVHQGLLRYLPEEAALFEADTDAWVHEGLGRDSLAVGDTVPDFTLPDQLGRPMKSADLLAVGPLVISFYRGSWCPYCSVELHVLQKTLPRVTELGATLVAISPQLVDQSLATAERYSLSFPVLSDVGSAVARRFGLAFALSEHLRPIYKSLGADLPRFNGAETFELPIPATFVVDQGGMIRAAHVNPDYKQRMEPDSLLAALATLRR